MAGNGPAELPCVVLDKDVEYPMMSFASGSGRRFFRPVQVQLVLLKWNSELNAHPGSKPKSRYRATKASRTAR